MYIQAVGAVPWWGIDPIQLEAIFRAYWQIMPVFALGVVTVAAACSWFTRPTSKRDVS